MESENERDATETLVIDRLSGDIEWMNRRYSYGEFRHCYHFPDQVNNLLDHFSVPELFCQPALPAEEITEEILWDSLCGIHIIVCVCSIKMEVVGYCREIMTKLSFRNILPHL